MNDSRKLYIKLEGKVCFDGLSASELPLLRDKSGETSMDASFSDELLTLQNAENYCF